MQTGAEANLRVNTDLASCQSTIQYHRNILCMNFFAKYMYLQYLWRFFKNEWDFCEVALLEAKSLSQEPPWRKTC